MAGQLTGAQVRFTECTVTLLLAALLLPTAAWAQEVSVPVRLDLTFVRQTLVEQIYNQPGERAAILDDTEGCARLDLYEPQVESVDGKLRVRSRGDARMGTSVFGSCMVVLEWKGFVEVFEQVELDPGTQILTFRVVDSNLYDENWEKSFASGRLWDLVKAYVHPRLAALRVDLAQPFNELQAWLPFVLPGQAERIERLLASLAVRDPSIVENGLEVTMVFDVQPRPAGEPQPEPTLSTAELERWQARWQQWDAFLTFVVKRFAGDASGDLRRAILGVLLDARHELLEALAPSRPDAPDPVPALFVRTWEQLAPVVRQAAPALPAQTILQYASFVAAGDALVALTKLGPEIGLEISADGLRRLARMVAPASGEDPLAYTADVDPELRALLGFDPHLPPDLVSETEIEADAPSNDRDDPPTPVLKDDGATLVPYWPWLVSAAWATTDRDALSKLNRWAPMPADVDTYLPLVRELLSETAERTLARDDLQPPFRPLYRQLVLATAWQESCWRQYTRAGARLVTLRSSAGSLGIMQVNQHVWRGVYDINGLLGDIAYNARAGSEILLHYLTDFAIARGEHERPGGFDNLPRATYAMYNGGPGHRTRYRAAKPKNALKRIDDAFWGKYRAVAAGREMEVARCYGG